MPASPTKQKPPGNQVNIGFDPADYERIVAATAIEELTPNEFVRDAALLAGRCPFAVANVIRVPQLTTTDGIRLPRQPESVTGRAHVPKPKPR